MLTIIMIHYFDTSLGVAFFFNTKHYAILQANQRYTLIKITAIKYKTNSYVLHTPTIQLSKKNYLRLPKCKSKRSIVVARNRVYRHIYSENDTKHTRNTRVSSMWCGFFVFFFYFFVVVFIYLKTYVRAWITTCRSLVVWALQLRSVISQRVITKHIIKRYKHIVFTICKTDERFTTSTLWGFIWAILHSKHMCFAHTSIIWGNCMSHNACDVSICW